MVLQEPAGVGGVGTLVPHSGLVLGGTWDIATIDLTAARVELGAHIRADIGELGRRAVGGEGDQAVFWVIGRRCG